MTENELVADENVEIPPFAITVVATKHTVEGEVTTRAVLSAVWPDTQESASGKVAHEPRLNLSTVTFGDTGEDEGQGLSAFNAPRETEVQNRPYRFNDCPIEYMGPGTPVEGPQSPPKYPPGGGKDEKYEAFLHEVVEEGAQSPQCHHELLEQNFQEGYAFTWVIAIHGVFSYKRGIWVRVNQPPQCERAPNTPDAPLPAEHCFVMQKYKEAFDAGRLDIIGDYVFEPGYRFVGFGGPEDHENECVSFLAELPTNPPEPDEGEWPLHSYKFFSGSACTSGYGGGGKDAHPYVCHWEHPQNHAHEIDLGPF